MIFTWMKGLVRTRFGRLAGASAGITLTVALVAAMGVFMVESNASMTARAVQAVPVDWQVQMVPGSDQVAVKTAIADAAGNAKTALVGYADVAGLEFKTDSVQSTGAGKVVGLPDGYRDTFSKGFRLLTGTYDGAVLLQQTAANLHAGPGDTIAVHRIGLADASVTVTGVVDLVSADTLFQAVGVPPGATPQAPPDNAVLMPLGQWQGLFDPQAQNRPDTVRMQWHVALDHGALVQDPQAAYQDVTHQGHNLEARVAGSALLANNLAASLDSARSDALYARVLFLFLGAPGIVLGILLTVAVTASGGDRRRRDQSLLRLRGASLPTIMRFATLEALLTAAIGVAGGLVLAALLSSLALGHSILAAAGLPWLVGAAILGLVVALCAVLIPAAHTARTLSVANARQVVGRRGKPLWQRLHVDVALLVLAGLIYWKTAASGYQIVLAPEGVAATSVDYTAFLAPISLWVGAALLALRLSELALSRPAPLSRAIGPVASAVAIPVAASLSRQRGRIAAGVALTALAFGFASSTAIFNTTYQGQARVDAELTNGADVTVTGTTADPAGAKLGELASLPGVRGAQAMQHRFAYVGTDLQDLYGIDPQSIGSATSMANAYFANGDAAATLAKLAAEPSAVLVSDETVTDYQLKLGDTINLRLQGSDHQYHPVAFTFAGVVREFPTAPRDSFIVANADYVAQQTGVSAREVVLLSTNGDLNGVKAAAQTVAGGLAGVRITSLDDASHIIGSSLTAVDLSGLTRLELIFAVLMVAGATGLVLALGLADRRRSFAILSALGARASQLAPFIWVEGALVFIGGAVFGMATGTLIAQVLVTELQGVFDPPPEAITLPWPYLLAALGVGLLATAAAVAQSLLDVQKTPAQRMKELQ